MLVSQIVVCAFCRHENSYDVKYCTCCGEKILKRQVQKSSTNLRIKNKKQEENLNVYDTIKIILLVTLVILVLSGAWYILMVIF
jgi:uncharacterized membrane protein YvbJ